MSNHHHHAGCEHESGDDHTSELGVQYSLYTKIDFLNLKCLNETREDSGKEVFKAWEDRHDERRFVESDVDEELLFSIPFNGHVKLKGIIVMGGDRENHPAKVKIFKNRPGMSFDDVGVECEQEFDLHPDLEGTLEYPIKVHKFSGVYNLSLYFPKNFGAESTKIYYIGLKGEFSEGPRQQVVICNYEVAPNPDDHHIKFENPPSLGTY